MTQPCEEIRDLLVDYADGELPAHDSQAVAEHLRECPPCRRTAEALERSLCLAKALWQDNLQSKTSSRRRTVRSICYAAVAASILIAAGVFFLKPAASHAAYTVEQEVARADTAARLLAATQILAKCEGTQFLVERQCRYILSNYADTPAAARLRTTDPSMLGATDND